MDEIGRDLMDSYEEPGIVPFLKDIPRFGKPDLSTLLKNFKNDDEDNTIDVATYMSGLTFVAVIVSVVVILWFLAISIMKFIPKTGFLSGQRFDTMSRYATPVRIVFLVTLVGWVVCTIFAYTEGIDHLKHSVATIERSSMEIDQIMNQASTITTTIDSVAMQCSQAREELVTELGLFCPDEGHYTINDQTGYDLDNRARELINGLENLGDFLDGNLEFINAGLASMSDGKLKTDETLEGVSGHFNAVFAFVLLFLILIPLFLGIGLILAWVRDTPRLVQESVACIRSFYESFLQCAVLPLLIAMTLFAAFFASSFSMAAIANTDFCIGDATEATPQETILTLLKAESVNLPMTTDIRLVLDAYISGECSMITEENDPFQFLEDFQNDIDLAVEAVNDFNREMLGVSYPVLSILCDRTGYEEFTVLLNQMGGVLETLKEEITNTQELVDCKNISPVLTHALNHGVCYYSLHGFASTFICFSAIALLGLILIMFRSSYLRSSSDEKSSSKMMMMDDDIIRPLPPAPPNKSFSFFSKSSWKAGANVDYGLPSHRPFITYDPS